MLAWIGSNAPAVLVLVGALLSAAGGIWSTLRQSEARRAFEAQVTDQQKQLLGADSYCYMAGSMVRGGKIYFQVQHVGKYQLYDVVGTAYRLDPMRELFKGDPNVPRDHMSITGNQEDIALATVGKSFALGTVLAGIDPFLVDLPLPFDDASNWYRFEFHARNGSWSQDVGLRLESDGKLIRATRVVREGRVVVDEVPAGFPRDANGDVDW